MEPIDLIRQGLTAAQRAAHDSAIRRGRWSDTRGQRILRPKAELIALAHMHLSKALEAERKGTMEGDRRSSTQEIARTIVLLLDYGAAFGYDLSEAIVQSFRE